MITMEENGEKGSRCVDQEPNLLTGLSVEYMRNIKIILINKPGISVPNTEGAFVTLKRHIQAPTDLVLHDEDEGQRPLFDRSDIKVNKHDVPLESDKLKYKNVDTVRTEKIRRKSCEKLCDRDTKRFPSKEKDNKSTETITNDNTESRSVRIEPSRKRSPKRSPSPYRNRNRELRSRSPRSPPPHRRRMHERHHRSVRERSPRCRRKSPPRRRQSPKFLSRKPRTGNRSPEQKFKSRRSRDRSTGSKTTPARHHNVPHNAPPNHHNVTQQNCGFYGNGFCPNFFPLFYGNLAPHSCVVYRPLMPGPYRPFKPFGPRLRPPVAPRPRKQRSSSRAEEPSSTTDKTD